MSTTTDLTTLTINYLTQAQYDAEVQGGTVNADEIYLTPSVATSSLMTDYIIEQGTSGNWTYRKWASGIAECWGTHSWTISSWTAWGNTYYSTSSSNIAYPSSLFNAVPMFTYHGRASTGDTWLAGQASAGTASQTPTFFLMRSSNGQSNITGYIDIHAIGTWK